MTSGIANIDIDINLFGHLSLGNSYQLQEL